ncbi:unnamed protein product [Fraxinus pennsylvanica]|uniref:Protodermal factor 1 n=1 Tax=Fraxinus pennsylvanica TaxID=56036 RepID=A0AAD2AAQ7_9LAMI|nr:unnamed protein product [Fraxinus pennsylvanica]
MERKRNKHASVLLWATMAALLAQNLVIPVVSSATFEDQKTSYSPEPRTGTPTTGSHVPPLHGSGGGHRTQTPSHGGESYCSCGNPPSGGHHHTTPSPPTGGGGGYYNPPSSSTPTTPTTPTPTIVSPPTILSPPTTPIDPGTPSIPSPPSGGGHRTPTPSPGGGSYGGTPPAGNCGNPPSGGHQHTTPSPPTGGGGGYYNPPTISTPTTPTVVSPPTVVTPPTITPTTPIDPGTPITPIDPGTPSIPSPPTGGGGGYYNTPPSSTPTTPTIVSPPTILSPPTTPIDPGTPSIPSPPFGFDPNSPPFTCDYWRTHPGLIWGLFGWLGTVGGAFGVSSLPGLGSSTNLLQALSNNRPDGLGALYREGTAALLNSMVHRGFPYTTSQVRDGFAASLSSSKAAAAQAMLFKQANEGRTKPRA